jgi:hypothetical protein
MGRGLVAIALTVAFTTTVRADESKYPDWRGQWLRLSPVHVDGPMAR